MIEDNEIIYENIKEYRKNFNELYDKIKNNSSITNLNLNGFRSVYRKTKYQYIYYNINNLLKIINNSNIKLKKLDIYRCRFSLNFLYQYLKSNSSLEYLKLNECGIN